MAERVRERNSKSRTTAKPSPPPAVVRRTILEFEFLSRIIASMQSMRWCRHDPAAVSYVFEPGQDDSKAVAAQSPSAQNGRQEINESLSPSEATPFCGNSQRKTP